VRLDLPSPWVPAIGPAARRRPLSDRAVLPAAQLSPAAALLFAPRRSYHRPHRAANPTGPRCRREFGVRRPGGPKWGRPAAALPLQLAPDQIDGPLRALRAGEDAHLAAARLVRQAVPSDRGGSLSGRKAQPGKASPLFRGTGAGRAKNGSRARRGRRPLTRARLAGGGSGGPGLAREPAPHRLHEQVEDGRHVECEELGEQQPADDGQAERTA
jgi:hypothetical protein